jgi:hypothetical protein
MSPRLLRLDRLAGARIDALVFRADSVRFEACPNFRGGTDSELCECGWLEADHVASAVSRRQFPGRRPRRPQRAAARQTA